MDLAGQDHRLRRARAGAEAHVTPGGFRCFGQLRVTGQDQPNGVIGYMRGDRDFARELLQLHDVRTVGDRGGRVRAWPGGTVDNRG